MEDKIYKNLNYNPGEEFDVLMEALEGFELTQDIPDFINQAIVEIMDFTNEVVKKQTQILKIRQQASIPDEEVEEIFKYRIHMHQVTVGGLIEYLRLCRGLNIQLISLEVVLKRHLEKNNLLLAYSEGFLLDTILRYAHHCLLHIHSIPQDKTQGYKNTHLMPVGTPQPHYLSMGDFVGPIHSYYLDHLLAPHFKGLTDMSNLKDIGDTQADACIPIILGSLINYCVILVHLGLDINSVVPFYRNIQEFTNNTHKVD